MAGKPNTGWSGVPGYYYPATSGPARVFFFLSPVLYSITNPWICTIGTMSQRPLTARIHLGKRPRDVSSWSSQKRAKSNPKTMSQAVRTTRKTFDTSANSKYGPPSTLSMARPENKRVTMRYIDYINLNASDTTGAIQVYRANSIFDPDSTGTGHQPYGRDTWATMFNHYTVINSKIQVQAWNSNTTAQYSAPAIACLSLDDQVLSAAVAGGGWARPEAGNCVYQLADCGNVGRNPLRMKKGFSAKDMFSKVNPEDNAQLGAAMGSSPSEQAYFHLWLTSADGGDPATMMFLVTIDYDVILSEPLQLVPS